MKALSIALLNLRRVARDRTNIVFMAALPLLLVLVIGQLFGGGGEQRLGVVVAGSGPLAERLVEALGAGRVTVERVGGEAELRDAVERGRVHAGVVVPPGYDAALRGGGSADVRYLVRRTDLKSQDVGVRVRSVVRREAARVGAARAAGGSFDEALAAADADPGRRVRVVTVGEAAFPEGLGAFSVSAPSMLLMFVFLTSLTAAVGLVETRMLGVSHRMYATPTRARTIIAGEALGRIAIALAQGLLIMLGSALLFGVDWGDPLAAAALLAVFSLVGAGAAMSLGAAFRTMGPPSSIAQVLGVGLPALGGLMIPLESFGGALHTFAHLTPHAWGYTGFARLVRHDAGLTGILPQLGVLAAYAAALFALGTALFRRSLTR